MNPTTFDWTEFPWLRWKKKKVTVKVAQSCPTLFDLMDCGSPGSSVISQARILEWVAILFSRGYSWPRDQTLVSYIAGRYFTLWATTKPPKSGLPFSPPEDLPNPGIKPGSPALQVDSLPSEPSPTFSSSSRDQTCAPAAEARCMSWAFI